MKIFLDTSGLLAYLDPREPSNPKAVSEFFTATYRLTHNLIATELVSLAHSRNFDRNETLEFVAELGRSEDVHFFWVDAKTHDEGLALLTSRPDKDYSLCDAVSFVLMRKYNLTDALTTDKHFEQEGFTRLLK
jgi:predicted nucleic acid-binding protein